MEHAIERQLTVPEPPEEVWESLTEADWLGEDALIELHPSGEVRAGTRAGFVENVEPPCRLSFWWSEELGEPTRVEIELDDTPEGTRVRVTETRPLALLDLGGVELAAEREPPRPPTPELSASLLLR
jgi:uncharacterized protein YndB with AHSA1/START domain